ncbi:MAG: FAD-dependent oxidoreductase [Cyanobacteria bacterium J06632_22]
MPVDYDLAIVGGTLAGRWAALHAAQMGARVVLAEPPSPQPRLASETLPLGQGAALAEGVMGHGSVVLSVSALAVNGVDVVLESPVFEAMQPVRLRVGDRHLSARRGLLAMAGAVRRYDLPAVMACQPCTPADFSATAWPQRVALVGAQAATVEWATALIQRGIAVTLVPPGQRILPAEDIDIQRLVTAQLRALGVRWGMPTHGVLADGQIGLKAAADDRPISVERVVLTDSSPPDLAGLNLPGLATSGPLSVNAYLQTQYSDLYAIGAVLGGEDRLALARAEAEIATENALFWHRRVLRYDRLHYSLRALTPIGRAGLTEQQARRYCNEVAVYQSGAAGQLRSAPVMLDAAADCAMDFCKLVVADGLLVGVHLMGESAEVAIALLAPYLGQSPDRLVNARVNGLEDSNGLAGQIDGALAQYRDRRWRPGTWRRDWAENWFNWRRSR